MTVKLIAWAGHNLISLYREGRPGNSPADQLSELFDALDGDLRQIGLSLENAVRHRLWTRDRAARDASNDVRARLITGQRRCATSSFIDAGIFTSAGDVAAELLAQVPASANRRRLVDFDPPRRYARYLAQDGMIFVSGMAEEGDTLDEQFANALRELVTTLELEKIGWRDVLSASLFLERGHKDLAWLSEKLAGALPVALPYVEGRLVDGLASPGKHLEIEITARRPAAA